MGFNTVISLNVSELERVAQDEKFGAELGRAVSASSVAEDKKAPLTIDGVQVGEVLETYHADHDHQIHVGTQEEDTVLVLIYNDSLPCITKDRDFGAKLIQDVGVASEKNRMVDRLGFAAASLSSMIQISDAGRVIAFQRAGQDTDLDVGGNTASIVEPS